MTVRCDFIVTDSAGTTELTRLSWEAPVAGTPTAPVTCKIVNAMAAVNATEVYLFATRGDLLKEDPTGEDSEATEACGRELVDEAWLEARVGTSGAYTGLDEWDSGGLALGAINAAQAVTVQFRLNIAAGAASTGEINFALIIRARTT